MVAVCFLGEVDGDESLLGISCGKSDSRSFVLPRRLLLEFCVKESSLLNKLPQGLFWNFP